MEQIILFICSLLLLANIIGPASTCFSKKQQARPRRVPTFKRTWGSWSAWSMCESENFCPAIVKRTRQCYARNRKDCVGENKESKTCSFYACKDLYKHVRIEGSCPMRGSLHVYRGYIANPKVCADACNEWVRCRGFTYSQFERTCYMESEWCSNRTLKQNAILTVSYHKIEPAGFHCGQRECAFPVTDPTLLVPYTNQPLLATWDDCAAKCRSTTKCKSFQWGPSNTVIQKRDRNLACYLFWKPRCDRYMASARSRFCKRVDFSEKMQNLPTFVKKSDTIGS